MSWAPIGWEKFSWEAFSTLVTGIAAVSAATLVGIRQLELFRRQTDISEQAENRAQDLSKSEQKTREQTLRLSLLDRRFLLIEEFRKLYTVWSQNGKLDRMQLDSLRIVAQRATFLFSDDITKAAFDCFVQLSQGLTCYERSEHYRQHDNEKSQVYLDKAFAAEDIAVKLMPKIMQELQSGTKIVF